MRDLKVELEFKLPMRIVKKKKWFLASCPVLDVFTQGDTREKARDNLIEALTLFLTSCIEMGTLNKVLNQCGFKTSESKRVTIPKKDYINIPIYLLTNHTGTKNCHA